MPMPTSIPQIPIAQSDQESIQESSEDSFSPSSMQVFHHVIQPVLNIDEDEVFLFQNGWSAGVITTSLTYVGFFILNWTISMTSMTIEWMD